MVKAVSSYSTNGLRDWLVQRITAVVMGLYALFLIGFVVAVPHIDYAAWHGLFAHPLMQIATVLVLLSLVLHAWISIWIVFTDYVKIVGLRLFLQIVVVLVMVSYFIWGVTILY